MSRNYEATPTEIQRMWRGEENYEDCDWIICQACNGSGELHPGDSCPVCRGDGEIEAIANDSN